MRSIVPIGNMRWRVRLVLGMVAWGLGFCLPRASGADGADARPQAEILLSDGTDSEMVLRRSILPRGDPSYFMIRTVGLKNVRARTSTEGRSSGPRVRDVQWLLQQGQTNTWKLVFERLNPQKLFDLEISGEVERGFQTADPRSGVKRTLRNIGVGEVWLMEIGHGVMLPHPRDQIDRTVETLRDLGMIVRILDLRRKPMLGSATEPRRWLTVDAETLLNRRGMPNFVPYFARQLAKEVRTQKDNIPAEEGTPVVLGFIFVDDRLQVNGRDSGLRGDCGLRAATEVNHAIEGVSRVEEAHFARSVLDRKRDGLPPGEPPAVLDRLSETVLRGPLEGFPVEDVSGFVRLRRGPAGGARGE